VADTVFFNGAETAVAGFHDGVRSRVLDTTTSALTTQHEAMHARIFRETPDGQLHAAFCAALQKKLVAEEIEEAVRGSATRFFDTSRAAQESFATYLSIRVFSESEGERLVSELVPEYRAYFDNLSNLIDPVVRSTYLQFLVAWNFAVAVFSSPLLERFPNMDCAEVVTLSDDEHPDLRFGKLIRAFSRDDFLTLSATFRDIASAACVENGLDPFDIEDDQAWEDLSKDEGTRSAASTVEEALSDALLGWLRGWAPFTLLHGPRLKRAIKGFEKHAHGKIGLDMKAWSDSGAGKASFADQIHFEAMSASQSRIVNSRFARVALGDRSQLSEDLLDRAGSIAVYSSCPPLVNQTRWFVFAWSVSVTDDPNVAPFFFREFDRDDVLAFLQRWLNRREDGRSAPDLRSIVIAVEGGADLRRILDDVGGMLWGRPEISDRLCWYWWGALYDVYSLSVGRPFLTSTIFTENVAGETDLSKIRDANYNGMVLKILGWPEERGAGIFVRALPMHSMAPILVLEQQLIAAGRLEDMPDEMASGYAYIAGEAFYAARSLWAEY
jgi:hypothetical protein